jgi:hypothetical protein
MLRNFGSVLSPELLQNTSDKYTVAKPVDLTEDGGAFGEW